MKNPYDTLESYSEHVNARLDVLEYACALALSLQRTSHLADFAIPKLENYDPQHPSQQPERLLSYEKAGRYTRQRILEHLSEILNDKPKAEA